MDQVWNLITGLGFGSLLTLVIKSLLDKKEKLQETRRTLYGKVLGEIRLYIHYTEVKDLDTKRRLHSLLSEALLYAGPNLRLPLAICANSLRNVQHGSVPVCLQPKHLRKIELLMQKELGVPRAGLIHRIKYMFTRCPCGSGKKYKKCHGS